MAAGFRTPLFVLGFARGAHPQGFRSAFFLQGLSNASLTVATDGNRSILDFWIGGVGENPTATGGWWHERFVRRKTR